MSFIARDAIGLVVVRRFRVTVGAFERRLTALDVTGNDVDARTETDLQAKVTVNRALTHKPASFAAFLDGKYTPDAFVYDATGGYRVTLGLDSIYVSREKRRCPPPCVTFDNYGDDYALL